jgi:hypothetical protein
MSIRELGYREPKLQPGACLHISLTRCYERLRHELIAFDAGRIARFSRCLLEEASKRRGAVLLWPLFKAQHHLLGSAVRFSCEPRGQSIANSAQAMKPPMVRYRRVVFTG